MCIKSWKLEKIESWLDEDDDNVESYFLEFWTWNTSKKHCFYFTCCAFDIYIIGINVRGDSVFQESNLPVFCVYVCEWDQLWKGVQHLVR